MTRCKHSQSYPKRVLVTSDVLQFHIEPTGFIESYLVGLSIHFFGRTENRQKCVEIHSAASGYTRMKLSVRNILLLTVQGFTSPLSISLSRVSQPGIGSELGLTRSTRKKNLHSRYPLSSPGVRITPLLET